jgi:hypothetical protein
MSYYIHNTNYSSGGKDDEAMLRERKAAAFNSPWKLKIERLKKGDYVFLYRSGVGIVAAGKANGKLNKVPARGQQEQTEGEYNMPLVNFIYVVPPLTAAEIKTISGKPGLVFRQMLFSLDKGGAKLYQVARSRAASGPQKS